MSYQTIQDFFADAMSLNVSTGFLAKQVCKASAALKQPYDRLVERLPDAGHVHSDETGFKENGERRWTWCFRAGDFTVFHIDRSRGSAVLEGLLGSAFDGIISCDFFSAYRKFRRLSDAALQFCWAHMIREVKFLAGSADALVSAWGNVLLEEIGRMFSLYHRRESLLARNWRRKMLECKALIMQVSGSDVPASKEARNLSIRLRDWSEEYFRFIDSDVPPTNNLCEQSLRLPVIDRRITHGTRSDWGNRWLERFWSVLSTCNQRGMNVMMFMKSSVGTFLHGLAPPSFLSD
jgi:hypothetical protein